MRGMRRRHGTWAGSGPASGIDVRQRGQLRVSDAGMPARILVEVPPPQHRPKRRHGTKCDKGKAPREPDDQESNDRCRQSRTETTGGVAQADRETARGERGPIGQRPVGRRQSGTLAHAEHKSYREQRGQPGHRCRHHCRDRPRQPADGQSAPRAEAVRHPATHQLERGIGVVEGRKGEAKCEVAEAKIPLHHTRRGGEIDPVDKQHKIHQAQDNQEIPGGASVEAEHWSWPPLGRLTLAIHS